LLISIFLVTFPLATNYLVIMKFKENVLDSGLINDIIVVLGLLISLFIFMEYSNEISTEVATIVSKSLEDMNTSVATSK